MIDASEGVTEQDEKIAGLAHEAGKGIILTVNKWDLIEKDTHTMGKFERMIRSELSFVPYAPILFISVKTGQRMMRVLDLARRGGGAESETDSYRTAECGNRRRDADEAAAFR